MMQTVAQPRRRSRDRLVWVVIFGLGLLARAVLIPLWQGQDFTVWDKAATATLDGTNIYAHHPQYIGGPYAYLPLFLYVELPMRWLATQTGAAFTVLGKLPILIGDIATTLLIAEAVLAAGGSRRRAALAAGAFFLNPLVLYDSAYYGRFDSVCCALLLLALRQFRRRGASPSGTGWYGLAIAAKTFPVFALAGVVRAARGAWIRAAIVLAGVIAACLLPYLGSLPAVVEDVIGYDAAKVPQGLSWQTMLPNIADAQQVRLTGYLLLALFVLGTVWLSRIAELDLYLPLTLALFLCLNKVILEQYLVWPLPWLAIAAFAGGRASRSSAALLATLTVIGCIDNESFHPWGRSASWLAVLLVVACLGYLAVGIGSRATQRSRAAETQPA